jgi:hypothetical protein
MSQTRRLAAILAADIGCATRSVNGPAIATEQFL